MTIKTSRKIGQKVYHWGMFDHSYEPVEFDHAVNTEWLNSTTAMNWSIALN
jgi:hypothetical protein